MGAIDYEYLFEGFRDSRVQNHTPTQAPTVSLRGPAQDLQNEREARVNVMRIMVFLLDDMTFLSQLGSFHHQITIRNYRFL